jgi:thioredoxin-dependent peroxiredoxin
MVLQLGDTAPDFLAQTTQGPIRFHEWLGESWGILFSHPKDFTPVCTTELGAISELKSEFERRDVKVMGLSVDPVSDHIAWRQDIEDVTGHALNFPLAGDFRLEVTKLYGMLPASAGNSSEFRTACQNQTARSVFAIDPAKRICLILAYPMEVGRNFAEIVRAIDALQLASRHPVVTPANWSPGSDVIISASISDDEAKAKFPDGWRAAKSYFRIVPQPDSDLSPKLQKRFKA